MQPAKGVLTEKKTYNLDTYYPGCTVSEHFTVHVNNLSYYPIGIISDCHYTILVVVVQIVDGNGTASGFLEGGLNARRDPSVRNDEPLRPVLRQPLHRPGDQVGSLQRWTKRWTLAG